MLTWEEDTEISALHNEACRSPRLPATPAETVGPSATTSPASPRPVSAPERHDPFEAFVDYIRARLAEDPHLWAITLFDELLALGFALSYQSLTRKIREQKLRPICLFCSTSTDRVNAVIEHPPRAETQWD